MTISLDSVGVLVQDAAKSVELCRRLDLEIPEGEAKRNPPYR